MTWVRLSLRIPEGRAGDLVELDDARASFLVGHGYATAVDGDVAGVYERALPVAWTGLTVLPLPSDHKEVWVQAAAALGIDTDGLIKDKVVAAVREAVG